MQAVMSAEECREIARMVAEELAAMGLLATAEPKPPASVDGFCRWYYGLAEDAKPTVAQRNVATQMCRDGKVPAFKVGRKWFIDMEAVTRGAKGGAREGDAA